MMVRLRSRLGPPPRAAHLTGPLITAITVLGVNAFTDGDFAAQPIYLACVAYAVLRGGVVLGLVSTALVVGDALIRAVAVPFGLDEAFRQVNTVALACLVLVLVTGHLKRRADRTLELTQANQELAGQLLERARTDQAATALAGMTRTLVEPADVGGVHQRIVSTILDVFLVRQTMLYLVDTASQELVCVAAAGDLDDTRWLGHRMPAGSGIAGRAVVEHRAVCAAEASREESDASDPCATQEMAAAGQTLALPLKARGKVVGALTLAVPEGNWIGETDLELLSIFAGHAALALENSRLSMDLRTALDKLGESQRRIVDDARLRATEEVAAGVAHHVNNRLTVILAGIQLLMPKLGHNRDWRRALEVVERTTLDTARLIDRLRQFTMGRPRGAAESADINLAVQRAVELCRPDHAEAEARGVSVEIVLELATVPRVVADEALVEEALAHLVRNAIEALAGPGTVTITTWAAGGNVLCAVSDTGIGMPEDVMERAAEPFFTTKGPQRPGLGLSCALGLVRQLRGQLDIRSEVNAGTRVTVALRAYVS
jgi:signal transduction histidine kinase